MPAPRKSLKLVIVGTVGTVIAIVSLCLVGPLLHPRHWAPDTISARVAAAGDLDAYLANEERGVIGVKPALVKGIVWRDSVTKAKTPLGVIYLHGFSASRRELSPVPERLADSLGANLFFTRLAAHGRVDGEAFATVTPQQWIDDAREAIAIGKRIGERVIIVATSTGATLALEMAIERPADIAAMILVSPNHEPNDPRARFISGPLGPTLARFVGGKYVGFVPTNAAHAELWTPTYRSEGIPAMVDLVNHERSLDLSRVKMPVLTLYTSKDIVVRTDLIMSRHAELGSAYKEIVDVPETTRHEMASDALVPQAVDPVLTRMLQFIRGLR
jgi:alpha-beta hydrolase superfamily lysophospholipase